MKSIKLDYTKRCAGEPDKGHNRCILPYHRHWRSNQAKKWFSRPGTPLTVRSRTILGRKT